VKSLADDLKIELAIKCYRKKRASQASLCYLACKGKSLRISPGAPLRHMARCGWRRISTIAGVSVWVGGDWNGWTLKYSRSGSMKVLSRVLKSILKISAKNLKQSYFSIIAPPTVVILLQIDINNKVLEKELTPCQAFLNKNMLSGKFFIQKTFKKKIDSHSG